MANFYSSEQVCTNSTRVFVPRSLKATFEQKLLIAYLSSNVETRKILQPTSAEVIGFKHMESVLNYLKKVKRKGAKVH